MKDWLAERSLHRINYGRKEKKMTGASKAQKIYGVGAVRYTLPQGFGGPIQLNIDFGLAPPPDTYYYASALSLRRNQSLAMVTLSFGRPEVRGTAGNAVSVVLPEAVIF